LIRRLLVAKAGISALAANVLPGIPVHFRVRTSRLINHGLRHSANFGGGCRPGAVSDHDAPV